MLATPSQDEESHGATSLNPAAEDFAPQAGHHPAGDFRLCIAGHSGFANCL
jgi:hypothetical protein